jgi:hypothetical protein
MNAPSAPPLNIQPQGLLDFFGIKNGGDYPQTLSNWLQPQLEMLRWYVASNCVDIGSVSPAFQLLASEGTTSHQITATQPLNLSGLVTAGQLMVPQNEFWFLDYWSVNWSINASATPQAIRVVPVVTPSGGAPSIRIPCSFGGYTEGVSTAGIHYAGHASMLEPFLARPGSTLALLNEGAIASADGINVNMQMRLARMRA